MNKSDYNTIKKKFKHKNLKLYYIHTDQLNSPRAITNNNQATNLGIDFNLRFPGQYSDNESGLFYTKVGCDLFINTKL